MPKQWITRCQITWKNDEGIIIKIWEGKGGTYVISWTSDLVAGWGVGTRKDYQEKLWDYGWCIEVKAGG